MTKLIISASLLIVISLLGISQDFHKTAILDESKVNSYVLPDIFTAGNGTRITTRTQWEKQRSKEILDLFTTQMFGKTPGKPAGLWFEQTSISTNAWNGLATRKEIAVHFNKDKNGPQMSILFYLPNQVKKPAPLFLCLNFNGNHTIAPDPGIAISKSWVANNEKLGITNHLSNASARGIDTASFPVELILKNGYGLATIYYGDIDPDFDDGFQNGVQPLFYKNGQTKPEPDEWGSIGAWAWGLMRAMDYMETDPSINSKEVAVLGHSRLGKAALWAGVLDKRFAIVISNESGCGGAALSKRIFGETVAAINTNFPHWFCANFKQYNYNEDKLPMDQHMLLALVAPRPLYVASASEDLWADPRGEYIAAYEASKVYKLYGLSALEAKESPQLNSPLMKQVGYHIRTGKHNLTRYDWEQYIKFADLHYKK